MGGAGGRGSVGGAYLRGPCGGNSWLEEIVGGVCGRGL